MTPYEAAKIELLRFHREMLRRRLTVLNRRFDRAALRYFRAWETYRKRNRGKRGAA